MDAAPILRARGLGRRHRIDERWLLRDIDLEVRSGQRLAVVGPTGAGKSLLLRALAMLDPLQAGEVLWHGATVSPAAVPQFRRQVIYLHQRPALLGRTVEENLRRPLEFRAHRDRALDRSRLLAWLEQVGRDASFLEAATKNLSGGERQLMAVLRALQLDPAILLLDEPTAALDAPATAAVERLLLAWQQETPSADTGRRRSLLWVSHDPAQVRRVADTIVTIEDGRIRGGGTPQEAAEGGATSEGGARNQEIDHG